MSWLLDTFVWTAVLIALVLLLRGPVARQFGPQVAYALWALPFLRLLLPPIELPAWLAPAKAAPPPAALGEAEYLVVYADTVTAPAVAPAFDWLALVPAIWLGGAALFLGWRFSAYFRMRRQLLVGARPVGECGRVRLVETPQVASPLAFGVLDKVVALPIGFMALYDLRARDLALEHELAHHRGHDLAVNFAVQPLFALHWFNPLSWLGWRAMRRDQEAACDARVIAARGLAERAAYASLIAGHAAGPRLALAAPMACPVLGGKSIVHRLRSLAMNDISRRRRTAGRALIGGAMLVLPLTASISYAEVPAAPEPPAAPAAPAAPLALLAPSVPAAPSPPEAPPAPLPPEAVEEGARRITVVRTREGDHGVHELKKVVRDGETVFLADGKAFNEAEFEAKMAALGTRLEGLDRDIERQLKDHPHLDEAHIRMIEKRAERAAAHAPEVRMSCAGEGITSAVTTPGGKQVINICERRIEAQAAHGLRRARDQIARNTQMSDSVRREIIRSLDQEIARLGASH